jgi:hypothetical protein
MIERAPSLPTDPAHGEGLPRVGNANARYDREAGERGSAVTIPDAGEGAKSAGNYANEGPCRPQSLPHTAIWLRGGEIGMTPWQLRQVQGAIERLEEERYRAAALGRPAGRRGCGRIAAPML